MSVTSRTCITVTCDRCGAKGEDEDSGLIPHFDSAEEAKERLTGDGGYGWALVGDPEGGIWTCQLCTAKATCDATGHDFRDDEGGWPPCRCGGRITGHPTTADHPPVHRSCDQCGHYERKWDSPAPQREGT